MPAEKVQQKSAVLHVEGKSSTQSFLRRRYSTPCITAQGDVGLSSASFTKQFPSHVDPKRTLRGNWPDTYNSDHQRYHSSFIGAFEELQYAAEDNEVPNSIYESIPTIDLTQSMTSLTTCLTSAYNSPKSRLSPAGSNLSTLPTDAQYSDSDEISQRRPMQSTELFGNNNFPPLSDTEVARLLRSSLCTEHPGNSLTEAENKHYNRKCTFEAFPNNSGHNTERSGQSAGCSTLSKSPWALQGLSSPTSDMLESSSSTVATIQSACFPSDIYLLQELFYLRDRVQEMQTRNGILCTELEKQKDAF